MKERIALRLMWAAVGMIWGYNVGTAQLSGEAVLAIGVAVAFIVGGAFIAELDQRPQHKSTRL